MHNNATRSPRWFYWVTYSLVEVKYFIIRVNNRLVVFSLKQTLDAVIVTDNRLAVMSLLIIVRCQANAPGFAMAMPLRVLKWKLADIYLQYVSADKLIILVSILSSQMNTMFILRKIYLRKTFHHEILNIILIFGGAPPEIYRSIHPVCPQFNTIYVTFIFWGKRVFRSHCKYKPVLQQKAEASCVCQCELSFVMFITYLYIHIFAAELCLHKVTICKFKV